MSIYDLRFTIVKFNQRMKPPYAVKIKERKWIWLNAMNARPHPGLLSRKCKHFVVPRQSMNGRRSFCPAIAAARD
jgi:hypothetical protein